MRQETRYKAIVIPYIGNHYVVVEDAKYKELTFVVGGCKRTESSLLCASRELYEETRGTIKTNVLEEHFVFSFESRSRSKAELAADKRSRIFVTMQYKVYMVPIQSFKNITQQYRNTIPTTKNMEETSGIYLKTKAELVKSNKMWRFMSENVLPKLK